MMMGDVRRPAVAVQTGPRRMSVRTALEWAFGPENAGLDFDHSGAREFERVGISPEWRMMQQAKLGCRVDGGGGGASHVHPDAALIAAAVEALELNPVFGRAMAVLVATCARSGTTPDWRGDPVRRVVPQGWDFDDDMRMVAHEVAGDEWSYRDVKYRRTRSGRGRYCPISYCGGARTVSRARRGYLDWYGALLELSAQLRIPGYLSSIVVTSALPVLSPWKNPVDMRQ
ncbi:hypothetical protein ERN12_02855 [Rhodobacteraceae bacterium]|nr:hypothetical protein ERN12_02855 [Paracoccaceae bacterium]